VEEASYDSMVYGSLWASIVTPKHHYRII